jgi:hypothetical protein
MVEKTAETTVEKLVREKEPMRVQLTVLRME